MKKVISILIIGIFILSSFGAAAIKNKIHLNSVENEQQIIRSFDNNHTVFGEYGTSTTCSYCKYAHGALKELYTEGELDFNYITLVCNKNSKAATRASEYNLYGYPTVWWDGGYKVNVGAGSVPSAKSAYTSSINNCLNREVEDVDIDLSATWLGGTEIEIEVTVNNNEASTYGGHIRVYITELESSMGWKDAAGQLYTFPFLDWAFNQAISISSGGSWSDSTTWTGDENGFSSVTEDNLMIFATVFNDEWHQGYSKPPSGYPFDAYYVDDSVAYRLGNNRAPNAPSKPNPSDGKTNVDINSNISWEGGDPDWFDTLYYDIYFGTTNPPPLIESDILETTFDPGTLEYETTYYWQIVATDSYGEYTESLIWDFTTESNFPPSTPEIKGPTRGIPGNEYSFTFVSADSDDLDVYYLIDWGDGNIEDWFGPFDSEQIVRQYHTYEEKSIYTIKAKAKDIFDAESAWGTFRFEVPRSKDTHNRLFFHLLERFPNSFPILKQLLGL